MLDFRLLYFLLELSVFMPYCFWVGDASMTWSVAVLLPSDWCQLFTSFPCAFLSLIRQVEEREKEKKRVLCVGAVDLIFLEEKKTCYGRGLSITNSIAAMAEVIGLAGKDEVIVAGVTSAKCPPDLKDVRCDLEPVLVANYVSSEIIEKNSETQKRSTLAQKKQTTHCGNACQGHWCRQWLATSLTKRDHNHYCI
ncbi:hypothetical protein Tco_0307808 [Tanacetum coccineum]